MKRNALLLIALFSLYLGLHNGYLAIWQADAKTPQQVFPYRAESFPPADRDLLTEGIPITSRRDLSKLLEDYLS